MREGAKERRVREIVAGVCDEGALQADGFEAALIGVANVFQKDGRKTVLAYDFDRMVKVLVKRDKMSEEDALEYLDFNVLGAYVGEGTPVYVQFIPRRAW